VRSIAIEFGWVKCERDSLKDEWTNDWSKDSDDVSTPPIAEREREKIGEERKEIWVNE
jgi:hypothetical protein